MSQPFVGEIRLFAGTFAPEGWSFCDGAQIPIAENETLFQLLGTTYGGDGVTTFGLPDLRGRVPVHQGSSQGASYTPGEMAGVEEVTLTQQQMPAHSHPFVGAHVDGNLNSPAGALPADSLTIAPYRNAVPDDLMNAGMVHVSGGAQPHDNHQPYLGLNFIISQFGRFPSQS
jgi:microcystin-dependent protein